MNRCTCFGTFLLILLLCTGTALALGSDYKKGQQVSHPADWPKGLKEAIEFQSHEGGYFVNANDFYWFGGDTQALNRFLVQSAKIDGAPVYIRFHSGKGEGKPPWPDKVAVPIDWQVSIFRRGWSRELPDNAPTQYLVCIDVWEGGQVNRHAVEVPSGIIPQPEQSPATAPIAAPTPAALRTGDLPLGSLGFSLGSYLTIEGERAEGFKAGTQSLRIDTINGRKLDATVSIWVDNVELPAGVRCTLKGYETARMVGTPPAVVEAAKEAGKNFLLPQAGWQVHVYFVALSALAPADLKIGPARR